MGLSRDYIIFYVICVVCIIILSILLCTILWSYIADVQRISDKAKIGLMQIAMLTVGVTIFTLFNIPIGIEYRLVYTLLLETSLSVLILRLHGMGNK